jgi:5-methylcytosine-specific restriction endonuclease McrA
MIINGNVFEEIEKLEDNSINTILSDPPYALGTKYFINEKGEWDIKGKSKDFMSKWQGILPEEWDKFFKEAFRFMKYGGYCVMFGMEENGALLNYYAIKNGLEVTQSLAWYNISGMPKALNVIKTGIKKNKKITITDKIKKVEEKYSGFYFSKKPLKPCLEMIYVFRKPLKNKGLIDDILEYENDNDEISPAIVNIDDNRVSIQENDTSGFWEQIKKGQEVNELKAYRKITEEQGYDRIIKEPKPMTDIPNGKYPSQLYIDEECSELLDNQSGISKSTCGMSGSKSMKDNGYDFKKINNVSNNGGLCDVGGCSRILHKCHKTDVEFIEEHGILTPNVNIRVDEHQKYWIDKGYNLPFRQTRNGLCVPHGSKLWVNVFDLPYNSSMKLKYVCEYCGEINENQWRTFIQKDEPLRCNDCEKKYFRIGENNANYIKDNRKRKDIEDRRKDPQHKVWRNKVFIRDDFTCQICNHKGDELNAHHLYSFKKYEELRYEVDNGITLCGDCHRYFHHEYGQRNTTAEQFYEHINNICNTSKTFYEQIYNLENIYYSPKVAKFERNAGCGELEDKLGGSLEGGNDKRNGKDIPQLKLMKNNHPTLKPMNLIYKIFSLFKLPIEDQKVLVPFSGTLSEYIGILSTGIKEENLIGIELSKDYCDIGIARKEYWQKHDFYFTRDKKEQAKIKKDIKKQSENNNIKNKKNLDKNKLF